MEIVTRRMKLAALLPATYNPRKDLQPGDPEYEKLKRSIDEYGLVELIVWNERTGNVVGGHQRLKVLKDMGVDEMECVVVDLDESREKALNIALNKISGEWDMPQLSAVLTDLDNAAFDLMLTGFDLTEIEEIITTYADENAEGDDNFDVDATAAAITIPTTELGDVYILGGKHRLMCGDATNPDDVAVLMDGTQAQLIVTDPPYNVDYEGVAGKIMNDHQAAGMFHEFLLAAFKNMYGASRPGTAAYIFHSDTEGLNFRNAFAAAGFDLKQCLIWVKNVLVLGRQDYQWKHEPILYGWKAGAAHYFVGERNHTTVICEDKPIKSELHPTMKPIPLVGQLIANSSKIGWTVADFFGGSGSTLMACEQLRRSCYTMELDQRFCDVIVLRYIALCSEKGRVPDVVLLRNGQRLPCPFGESDK